VIALFDSQAMPYNIEMKLQISTDYAIRILRYLCKYKYRVCTAVSIAEATGIPHAFFIKIANQLKKRGLLASIRGRNGGYFLGKAAHKINLYEVFLCVEGELQINQCLKDHQLCATDTPEDCKIRNFLCTLQETIIAEMSSLTLVDLID